MIRKNILEICIQMTNTKIFSMNIPKQSTILVIALTKTNNEIKQRVFVVHIQAVIAKKATYPERTEISNINLIER